ncbi:MAG: hypothetical protein ACK5M4_09705 [Pseudorhodobacter sp.]
MSIRQVLLCGLAALAFAGTAKAECFADYKAKQDNPLRLHYGVADIPDSACSSGAAAQALAPRLAAGGWTLLNVISVFGPEGLEERKASAGNFFRRF